MAVSVLFAALMLSGCTKDDASSRGENREALDIAQTSLDEMANEADSIRILAPGVDPKNTNHQIVRGAKQFEAKTGKRVEFIQASYDDWQSKLVASIASKSPFDVLFCTNSDYPLMAIQDYTQPIEKYVPMNESVMNKYAMDEFFTYNGKYYTAVPIANCSPYMMYYNKNIVNQNGLDDPMELYKGGKWDYETMVEMATSVTADTNNDGQNDIWGMTTLYPSAFLGMNKTSAVTLDENGKFVSNLDSPALIRGLEMAQDAYYGKSYCGGSGGSSPEAFMAGTHLFLLDVDWAISTLLTRELSSPLPFEWGWVPIPYGPDNTEQYNIITANGFNIVQGSKNPYTAGVLIQYLLDEGAHNYGGSEIVIPEEFKDLCKELIKKPFYSLYYDSIIDGARDLLAMVNGGGVISKCIEERRNGYQEQITKANTLMVLPEPIKLPPVTLDFESGVDMVKPYDPRATISQATGDAALDGNGSLKLDFAASTLTIDAFYTDAGVAPLAGYNYYEITFDYFEDSESIRSVYEFIYFEESTEKAYGSVTYTPEKVGEKAQAKVKLSPARIDSGELSLLVSIKGAGSVVLDNIQIVQVD